MEKLENSPERICGFYVSDWHLVTMILPYINKELNEKANIVTILEKDIEKNIKTLISKLNLKNEKKVLKLNWKASKEKNINEILNKNYNENDKNNILFVSGSKTYIDVINNDIFSWMKENKIKNENLKIINCYEVTEFNNNIVEILNSHNKVLNTSGERYIYVVFDGYSEAKEMC